MNNYADTIRRALQAGNWDNNAVLYEGSKALDALVAENQRLRNALGIIAEHLARAALDGTP